MITMVPSGLRIDVSVAGLSDVTQAASQDHRMGTAAKSRPGSSPRFLLRRETARTSDKPPGANVRKQAGNILLPIWLQTSRWRGGDLGESSCSEQPPTVPAPLPSSAHMPCPAGLSLQSLS